MLRAIRLSIAVMVISLSAATTASADLIQVPSKGPGPEQFDSVDVHTYGPKKPKKILVLLAGTNGGAGNFTQVAKDLTDRVKGLGVWSVDRRSQVLEDTSAFESALAGDISPDDAFNYYLGWLAGGTSPAGQYEFLDASTVPFAQDWGMETALNDARTVIKGAKKSAKTGDVYLGGHSLGASLAAAYGAWDFNGKPGYKDLAGIVMIDGGLLGSFDAYTKEEAEEQVSTLEEQPFLDLLGVGIPEAAGLFAESGAIFARLDPDGPATTLQNFPLLPADFKPPVPATNEAAFGYAFDRDTSPEGLALLHVNAGQLAASGDPRPWVDGGVTDVANLAKAFGSEPANGVEWFFPRRLTIDTNGADQMKQNDVAKYLGLRLEHTKKINVPIYAFQTDLTDGGVLEGAERLVKKAKTKPKQAMLVDGDPVFSHLDPLTAGPDDNKFTKTVAKFLKK
jgi:pimeloyl-ACP methyl ester carboxylesterase